MIKFAEIVATFIDACFLAWFVPKFCGESANKRCWFLVFPLISFFTQCLFDCFLPNYMLVSMLLLFVFVLIWSVILSKGHYLWSVFTACTFVIIVMLNNTLIFMLFSSYIDGFSEILHGSQDFLRVLYLIIAKLTLFVLYRLTINIFGKDKKLNTSTGWLALLLTTLSAIGLSLILKLASIKSSGGASVEILVLSAILVAVNVLLYFLIWQNQKLQKNKYELQLVKDRIAFEEKRGEDANIIWRNIKNVRHDLKNHFSYLKTQLKLSNYDKCLDYLESIESDVDNMGSLIKSGNSVVDYLINTKLSILKDVRILIAGNVENFKDIADSDMVCILGNILDNAVEAIDKVQGNKRIELYFYNDDKHRMLICKNTIIKSVLDTNQQLLSTKKDSEFHGIGHKIIESTAEKYCGFVDYFEEEGMFGVQVLLPGIIDIAE